MGAGGRQKIEAYGLDRLEHASALFDEVFAAAKHGVTATFMAKPFAEYAGSGLHLHLSLEDAAGRNLFADAASEGSLLLSQCIGGMRETMAESVAIFAPNGNSYRRFRPLSYAPIAPTWGVNNRSVSLRVPSGPPVVGNGYSQAHRQDHSRDHSASLPSTWQRALECAGHSQFLTDYLGADFLKVFLAIEHQECDRFNAEVSDLDYDWYLRTT